jgi:hypothetical protein
MIPNKCKEALRLPKIKVEENLRSAVFDNPAREVFDRIRVDNCVIREGLRADYAIAKRDVGDVIIELKGRDVERASKQVIETAKYWCAHDYRCGRIADLIVCRQYPSFSTTVQRAAQSFKRQFDGPLHAVAGNYEYHFEKVLNFGGPLRAR